nr:hypothetical protein [Deltaproteobacteria bacterium]
MRLGKGGFGVVHLARDVDLDREIAIKVLKPEYLTKPQIERPKKSEPPKSEPPKVAANCDRFDDLLAKAQEAFTSNRPAAALVLYGQAHLCKPSESTVLRFALAAACKSKNVAEARIYWKKMSAAMRTSMETLCAGNGIYQKDLS